MRNLTHYELKILIKSQLELLVQEDARYDISITYIAARCEQIIKYVDEYFDEDKVEENEI